MARNDDDFAKFLRKAFGRRSDPGDREDPRHIPVDKAQRLAELRKETDQLGKLIDELLARERAGDTSVRAELDPIVRRDGELRYELWELEKSLGLLGPEVAG